MARWGLSVKKTKNGFSLVELMVALGLGIIATVGMYKTYISYSTCADAQDQVLELQQNLRVVMNMMIKEIRMAGYDPDDAANAGFVSATDASVQFTTDLNDDGDLADDDENISYFVGGPDADGRFGLRRRDCSNTYAYYLNKNTDCPAGNGSCPASADMPLNFIYLDADRNVLATPVAGASLQEIKFAQITLVLRSSNEDYSYTNNTVYTNLQNNPVITAKGDHFRRQRLTAEVNVRNTGL